MFKRSKIAKITMGYAVGSLMLFAAVMPVNAAGIQLRENIGTEASISKAVQEDSLSPMRSELVDIVAEPVDGAGNDNMEAVQVIPEPGFDRMNEMDSTETTDEAITVEEEVKKAKKGKLAAAIEKAGKLNEADYTAESWSKVKEALVSAETVMNDDHATQKAVDKALKKLNKAIDALEEVKKVEKGELAAAIEKAGKLNEADYTAESWSKVKEALVSAETVMDDDQATQEVVDEALAKLNKAIEALEEVKEEDEKSIQIGIYKELLEAFEKMQNTFNELLDMFGSIFGK